MSLEVTLIPLALVVINVVDKAYYESWINRKRVKKVTSYDGINDFLEDLNKTGYKYDVQYGTVRICSDRPGERYYFSRIAGKWVLSFSEYDSKESVSTFMKLLSDVSGGKVTGELPQAFSREKRTIVSTSTVNAMPSLSEQTVSFYPTIFNDFQLLKEALRKLGIDYSVDGDVIEYTKDGTRCTFIKDEQGKYMLRTVGNITSESLYRALLDIDIIYKKDVQKRAYDSVISKLPEHNMTLENEVRMEDDTIVLTLNVE